MRPIPNFPGYFATEDGKIYSTLTWGGHGNRRRGQESPRELRPGRIGGGRFHVTLFRHGLRHQRFVHRLILETFVGPCPVGMICCHGPAGRGDHSLNNLEWGTQKKNCGPDKIRDGKDIHGEEHKLSKLNELKVRIIRRAYSNRGRDGISGVELGRIFGVTRKNICEITRQRSWRHI